MVVVTFPYSSLFLFILVVFILLQNSNCQNESVNLYQCCPSNYYYENGICSEKYKETVNGSLLSGLHTFLEVPYFLSMSSYSDKTRVLKFSLRSLPQPPMCSKGEFSLKISFIDSNINKINFTLEGYLKIEKDYYAPNEYCISRYNDSEKTLSMIICKPTCSDINPCIKRCCEFGQVWDLSGIGRPGGRLLCKPSGEKQWDPILYNDPYTPLALDKTEQSKILPHFISDHPKNGWCNPTKSTILPFTDKLQNSPKKLIRVLKDGKIVQKLRAMTWEPIKQNVSCIDGAQNFPGYFDKKQHSEFYTGDPTHTIILYCPDKSTQQDTTIFQLYRIAMIISCVFLLLTIIVYVLLWDKQNVHGWSILCYITSLFFMYISLCLMHFSKELQFTLGSNGGGGGTLCYIIGVSIHFFFICTFCWLTIINFDLWYTFRVLKPTAGKSKGLKRFLIYSLFALGAPIIVLSVSLSLDFTYRDDIESDVIVPLYGLTRCYMEKHKPMLVYVYGPVAFLISLNLIFFIFTIYSMYKIQKSTSFASNSSSKTSKDNQSAKLFIKLFIIMGVCWIFEVISWAESDDESVSWYFVIFDLINILQPIFIFIIFVCKKETLKSLTQKYPKFKSFVSSISPKWVGNSTSTSSIKSTRTELSFTDNSSTTDDVDDKIEMSSQQQQQQQQREPQTLNEEHH